MRRKCRTGCRKPCAVYTSESFAGSGYGTNLLRTDFSWNPRHQARDDLEKQRQPAVEFGYRFEKTSESAERRAFEWNVHNDVGIWIALPFLIVLICGLIMAYPWATRLLYRAAGTPAPPPVSARPAAEDPSARRLPAWRNKLGRLRIHSCDTPVVGAVLLRLLNFFDSRSQFADDHLSFSGRLK